MTPRVSVVIPCHNRPQGITRALAALRAQLLPLEAFEVVVVDDGSGPETVAVLDRERELPGLRLRVLRNETPRGPAGARNVGWREAQGELIAFTDDDCMPSPRWLEAALRAWDRNPQRFVQGPVEPESDQPLGPYDHTITVSSLGPWWETANVFYPREALELMGGFDEAYPGPGGEDTDLGWTLIEHGYEPVWAPHAVVRHEVVNLGPRGKLRLAWRWADTMLVFRRHPQMRRHLTARVFWIPNHWWLVRAAIALALPSRLWWLRWWLAAPYVRRLGTFRPDAYAFHVVHDLVQIGACARGSLRHRVLVL